MEKLESPKRPSTWNSHRRGQVPQYKYKTINDIYTSNDFKGFHNVYGVIIDSRLPEKSKGSGTVNFFFVCLHLKICTCICI